MSIYAMTLVWRVTDLNQSQTLVALAIADHANDEGFCWPSIKTLATKSRLSERQVQRIIRELEDGGILVYAYKPGKSNVYKLDLQWLSKRGDMVSGVQILPRTNEADP
jgi:hypothetical protein